MEERKTDKRLLKKDSTVSVPESDTDGSPRKRKKKRRSSSKLREARVFVEDGPETQRHSTDQETANPTEESKENSVPNGDVKTSNTENNEDTAVKFKKRVKKRQSSKLEDMLHMSDDSIEKEDVEEVKVYKGNKGKKRVVVHKISSALSEEIKPPEDSLDEEEKEDKEFYSEPAQADHLDIAPEQELELSKEQTTLIKDVVERKKKDHHLEDDNGLTKVENDRVTFYLDGQN